MTKDEELLKDRDAFIEKHKEVITTGNYSWDDGCSIINDAIDFHLKHFGKVIGNKVGPMSFRGEFFIMEGQISESLYSLGIPWEGVEKATTCDKELDV